MLHAQRSATYHPNSFEPIYAIGRPGGLLFVSSNTEGIGTRVTHIRIVGDDLLIVTFNPSFASRMLYRSADGGNTFAPDTVELPKVSGNNECVNIDRIEQRNGWGRGGACASGVRHLEVMLMDGTRAHCRIVQECATRSRR